MIVEYVTLNLTLDYGVSFANVWFSDKTGIVIKSSGVITGTD